MNKKDLFEKCLDLDEELMNNFYMSLSCMEYEISSSIGKINSKNYINKLINYISNQKELRDKINECIINQVTNEEDIIIKIFQTENAVNQGDIDIISVILRHLSNSYTTLLKNFYCKAEKDNFFSSLLFFYYEDEDKKTKEEDKFISEISETKEIENTNEENNNIKEILKINDIDLNEEIIKKVIAKTKRIYLENINFNNSQMINNKLQITLGLILPGMRPCIELLTKKFNSENNKNYKKNERNLRLSKNDDLLKDYYEKLKNFTQSTILEIQKEELLSKITRKLEENELIIFYCLLLNDYYTLFIDKNLNKSKIDLNVFLFKKVLNLLFTLRIKESQELQNREIIETFSNAINWMEAYSDEITINLQIFSKLNKLVENLYEQINEIIFTEQIDYEISKRSSRFSSIVNKSFFYVIESILRVVTSNEQIYINKKNNSNDFFNLINTCKEILNQALQINISLRLNSKEVFSLQELLAIIIFFYKNKIDINKNIKSLIQFFSYETSKFNSKREEDLIENLNNLFKILKDLTGNCENYGKLMGLILKNEYKKSLNEKFRLRIFEIILNDKNILYHSSKLIKSASFIGNTPEEMKNNLNNLKKNSQIIELFNKCKEEYLDELIINSFEYEIVTFFENIPYLNFKNLSNGNKNKNQEYFEEYFKNKDRKINILFNLPLAIFDECLQFLDILYNKEKKICQMCVYVNYIP